MRTRSRTWRHWLYCEWMDKQADCCCVRDVWHVSDGLCLSETGMYVCMCQGPAHGLSLERHGPQTSMTSFTCPYPHQNFKFTSKVQAASSRPKAVLLGGQQTSQTCLSIHTHILSCKMYVYGCVCPSRIMRIAHFAWCKMIAKIWQSMCWCCRSLDRNQIFELPAGLFYSLSSLRELWVAWCLQCCCAALLRGTQSLPYIHTCSHTGRFYYTSTKCAIPDGIHSVGIINAWHTYIYTYTHVYLRFSH
jgi:hypothetical protein